MKYRIIGNTMPAVEIKFDSAGESIFTQSGGMTWMSEGIHMSTNTRGGLMKGIGACSLENHFLWPPTQQTGRIQKLPSPRL